MKTDDFTGSGGAEMGDADLRRLRDCDDLEIADGYPDIRGWEVRTSDGHKLGKVHDLVISVSQMRARYIDVDVDDQGHALVPIGTAQIDDEHDVVQIAQLTGADSAAYPRYSREQDSAGGIDRDYEETVRNRYGSGMAAGLADATASGRYDSDHFDDQRLFSNRRADETQRITLAEERLAIGKQETQAGEVSLRKHVETEHVREEIPLVHDEVSVDRRPLDRVAMDGASIGDDQEIRVPLSREEAVVEKRAVAREELIIRKRMVTENKTVEADLRRERVDIDDRDGRVQPTTDNDRRL